MTLPDLFHALNVNGIRLANVGGRLQLRGPAVPEGIRDAAAEHKAAILAMLPPEPTPPPVAVQNDADAAELAAERTAIQWADALDPDAAARLVDAWEAIKLPEHVLFVDDDGFRWFRAHEPAGIVREDAVGLDFTGTATASGRTIAPTPPAGARIYSVDADARPCSPATSHMWTWEGGPQWFYAREFPVSEYT